MGKAKRIKSKKDVKQRQKVRNVTPDQFEYIERVWAEDGVVKAQVKETGRIVNMTVKDAATRAQQINLMPVNEWHVNRRNDLVTRIYEACMEAKRQMEDPKDSRAKAMNNLLQGLAPDGRSLEQIMKDQPAVVQEAQKLQGTFVHLNISEITTVLKEDRLPKEARMKLLAEEDWRRAQANLPADSEKPPEQNPSNPS
jgi:hypothetical protein